MALVKVYEWDFYSIQGSKYRIELHQDGGTPLASGLDLGGDGFIMSSNADEDDRFSPVIGTEVKIPILIEDSTAETFINQIVVNQERNSFIKIFVWSGSAWSIFYRGIVLQDLAKNEDKYYPYQFELSATDGFGRLKDIPFNNAGSAYTGKSGVMAMLLTALDKIGLNDLYTTSEIYLSSGMDWSEVNADSGDLIVRTQLAHEAFYTIDDNGTQFISTYEVLNQILRCFGARIIQLSGAFHIVSISRYKTTTNSYFYNYSKTGTALTYTLKSLVIPQIRWHKLADSIYNRYPALNRVVTKYKYRQSQYPESFIPQSGTYNLTQYEYIEGGGGEKLGIKASVLINYDSGSGASASTFRVKFKLTCYVGSYWLQGQNGIMQWVSGPNQYYYFYSQGIYAAYDSVSVAEIDLITPVLLDEGYLNFALTVDSIQDMNGNTFTPPSGYSISYDKQAKVFYVGIQNEFAEGVKEVIAYNVNGGVPVNSASVYTVDELLIGDAVYLHDVGRIQIYNGTTWVNSSEWDYGTEYGGISLEKLRTNEILSGQRTPRVQFDLRAYLFKNVTFSDICNPVALALYNNSEVYVPLSVQFIAGTDEIAGSFFEIIRIVQEVTNDEATIAVERSFNAANQTSITNLINGIQGAANLSKCT